MKGWGVLSMAGALCVGLAGVAFGASSGPTTKTLTAKLVINYNQTQTPGACPNAGYATLAACSTDTCSCLVDPNATISGKIAGKGTAVVSITEDESQQVPLTPSNSKDVCTPMYVNADINSTLKGNPQTETISMHLVICHALTAKGNESIDGGFGIETTPPASNGATGWGTVTGSTDNSTETATLTLKGSITQ